ncbi:MAG: TrkH family potassium uptake protein [Acidobacteria bacterium]|nr:MAG: TrkH family potassium uptake protein [Acidobacteriota bacterium]REK00123.1 MAG: TrkH family potassium uptake protein [Acidobacteriota bacterium]
MNLRTVFRLVGRLLLLLAAAHLVPVICALLTGEPRSLALFALSATLTAVVGAALSRLPASDEPIYRREGVLFVVLGWLVASIVGAVPLLLDGSISAPVDALFESASGFTTTGASILVDIEALPRSVLLWRSFTQWLGGLGIIVLLVALLAELGPGTRFLYRVEVPGPTTEFLRPRVRETAAALLRLYLALTGAMVAAMLATGVGLYDAVAHTFTTLSTGGFSPYNASAAAFAPGTQVVILVFMVIAGMNFSLLHEGLRGRANVWRNRELTVYVAILLLAIGLVLAYVPPSPGGDGIRLLDASFQVVSLMTSTGFASRDFDQWPSGAKAVLVILMLIGGSAGSTAGGIKVMRILVGFKSAMREARLLYSPNLVLPITLRGQVVPDNVVQSVTGFLVLFLMTLFFGTLLLALGGADLITAFTAALACLSNIGPGLGEVGPTANFSAFAAWEKLLLVLLMLLGRLEMLAIAALITRPFWRS